MDIGAAIAAYFAAIEAYNANPSPANKTALCNALQALQAVYPSDQWLSQLPEGVTCP